MYKQFLNCKTSPFQQIHFEICFGFEAKYLQTKCLLYILFTRCKLYAVAVIS